MLPQTTPRPALRPHAVAKGPSSPSSSPTTPTPPTPSGPHESRWSDRDRFIESQRTSPLAQRGVEAEGWTSRFGNEPRKGADIIIEALEREGVSTVFAYPGGASMEIHQALTRSNTIKNVLCRHEQGEVFAAEGFGKCTGEIGVCIATSGPGATNLVTGLADALLDSVPMVAITGQVPRPMIGTDAFQETPIVEITRQITKHNYLVMDIEDIPRVIAEAFVLARSGRPGPVLVDIPKDVQQQIAVPKWDAPVQIVGYMQRLPSLTPSSRAVDAILEAIRESKRPVLYVGGGAQHCADEVTAFAKATGIPVANTLMGLGTIDRADDLSLSMLGMHGTVVANYAVDSADLLLAMGVRFDDRVTGKLESFATRARIVHVDVDPAEISKNKHAHIPVCADVKGTLQALLARMEAGGIEGLEAEHKAAWREELSQIKREFPMTYPTRPDVIMPQQAIEKLSELTNGEAVVTTGVGQHQMWAAQYYQFKGPRQWVTSGGLGSMGFGYPSALGAAVAYNGQEGRPKKVVVDIDGDGSFLMNIQELATARVYGLDIKCLILNNQHLGMVVQWEDRFYGKNRAHTYLGRDEAEWHETSDPSDIFPDFVKAAEAFDIPAKRIFHPDELEPALQEMLDTPGPYLLDVMVPHIQHVLPMIPGGGGFKDVITSGDGENPMERGGFVDRRRNGDFPDDD